MNDDKLSGLLPGHGVGQNLSEEELAMFAKPLNEGFLKNPHIPVDGYKRDDFIVQVPEGLTNHMVDLDIVHLYPNHLRELDMEKLQNPRWLDNTRGWGELDLIRVADILTHAKQLRNVRYQMGEMIHYFTPSRSLTRNYKFLLKLIEKRRVSHFCYLYIDVENRVDILITLHNPECEYYFSS